MSENKIPPKRWPEVDHSAESAAREPARSAFQRAASALIKRGKPVSECTEAEQLGWSIASTLMHAFHDGRHEEWLPTLRKIIAVLEEPMTLTKRRNWAVNAIVRWARLIQAGTVPFYPLPDPHLGRGARPGDLTDEKNPPVGVEPAPPEVPMVLSDDMRGATMCCEELIRADRAFAVMQGHSDWLVDRLKAIDLVDPLQSKRPTAELVLAEIILSRCPRGALGYPGFQRDPDLSPSMNDRELKKEIRLLRGKLAGDVNEARNPKTSK